MDYNDIEFDESDYEFFVSLPTGEKILFLFDMLCTNLFEDYSNDKISEIIPASYEDLTGPLKSTVAEAIDFAFSKEADVNIVFVNDFIVINSDNEKILKTSVREIFMRGYVLSEMKVSSHEMKLFQRSTFCKIYSIIGHNDPILKN
jgi:hypothetical protein